MTITVHIIDDCQCYAGELVNSLREINVSAEPIEKVGEKTSISELADMLASSDSLKRKDLLYINTNLKIADSLRQDQSGFKLLTWLRVKDVLNHCVLYSFETLHSLLQRSPDYLIATSKGTSFVQLPFDLASLDVIALSSKEAESTNIREVLRKGFSIQRFRHREANWWGVMSICDIHRAVVDGNDFTYPEQVKKKLGDLEFVAARYVYGFAINRIQEAVKQHKQSAKEEFEKLSVQLKEVEDKIGKIEIGKKEICDAINTFKEDIENQQSILKNPHISDKDIQDIIYSIRQISIEQQDYKNLKEEMDCDISKENINRAELENKIYNASEKCKTNPLAQEVSKSKEANRLIEDSTKNTGNILYIDDNAQDGWLTILQEIFPVCIDTPKSDSKHWKDFESLSEHIFETLRTSEPSLILLDLRLFDENVSSLEVEELSGFKLLERIKKSDNHHYIPIIMFTASNKAFTYETLVKNGANGYWVKEGLDEQRSIDASIKNYLELLRLINNYTNGKYNLMLRRFGKKVKDIRNNDKLWWKNEQGVKWVKTKNCESMRNSNGDDINIPHITRPFDKEKEITICLKNIYRLLDDYLYRKEFSNLIPYSKAFIPSLVCLEIGLIIEYIHDFTGFFICNRRKNRFKTKYINMRGDTEGNDLYYYRNAAVHASSEIKKGQNIIKTLDDLVGLVERMVDYLNKPPVLNRTSMEDLQKKYSKQG